jgi:hypothetical protein
MKKDGEGEIGSEREEGGREGERERQVIVWSCWVSSLGILD